MVSAVIQRSSTGQPILPTSPFSRNELPLIQRIFPRYFKDETYLKKLSYCGGCLEPISKCMHVQFPTDHPGKKCPPPPKVWNLALGADKSHIDHHLKLHLEIIWDLPAFVTSACATQILLGPCGFYQASLLWSHLCLQKHWKVVFPSAEAGKPSSSGQSMKIQKKIVTTNYLHLQCM